MKSILIIPIIFNLLISSGFSQSLYCYDSIPKNMLIDADAVIRSSQEKLTIINENKAYIDYKITITLLNENAEAYNTVKLSYNELSRVSQIKASAYNENGKEVWVLKKYDIYDNKDFNGPEYLDNSRVKVFKFPSYNYPYTIEYSCRYQMESLLLNPISYFQSGAKISIEKSGIQCLIPKSIPFQYKNVNLKSSTDSTWVNDILILTWQEENMQAKKQKNYAPKIEKTLPTLYRTAERFSLGEYQGDLSSWESYSDWINKINEGRDILSKEYADQVLALISNATDSREKIRILYEYMQSRTRYFNISFGIGGYQPIQADQVAQNGYGDCKALSNYMKALLKVAGIESYYTLVKAGKGENIEPDFPSNQFNHVILCIPDKNDTIWLECTDQTIPFGYLGSFTSDRYVLVVTPHGGKIRRTPSYGKNDNVINTLTEISIDGSGDADAKVRLHQTGLCYDVIKMMSDSKEDVRKNIIAKLLGYSTFILNKEEYSFGKTHVPFGNASFDVLVRNIAAKGEKRLFLSPSLLSKFSYTWEDPTEIELSTSYQQNDTVKITIPLGYKIEYLPGGHKMDSRFGSYSSQISSNEKYIYFIRTIEINKADYPKEMYGEFYNFINEIATNDQQMLILKSIN
jgi:hypothetical protein